MVDCSSQVIVACDVVQDGNDKLQLGRMFSRVQENLGRLPEKLLADAGYFSTKEIEGVEGTELFVATKSRKKAGMEEFLPIIELGAAGPRPSRRWSCCSARTRAGPRTVCAARRWNRSTAS